MKVSPILNSDFYKQSHHRMYPENMTLLYSNLTPRKSRIENVNHMVFFGLQYYIKEYLIDQWNELFFKRDKKEVINEYSRFIKFTLGEQAVHIKHIEDLHDLGYLPIKIKAISEGLRVPMKVPCITIYNTHPDFAWLTNFLETSLSNVIWSPCTTATIADNYRKIITKFCEETGSDISFVNFQGHDFAQRGYSSVETSMSSGAGHLLSFAGTDTIPAILFLEEYYGANIEKELVGTSVPATEHSVVTSYGKEDEIDSFKRIISLYPTGIISLVSDSFDLWKVCTEYLTELKDIILARDGKVVIRPDSGDPADIICGNVWMVQGLTSAVGEKVGSGGIVYNHIEKSYYQATRHTGEFTFDKIDSSKMQPESKGVVELLWDIFGGTINDKGYKELDPHIGAIYGDSISPAVATDILERLKAKGFAASNIVFGIGSYTYQHNTRDTFGLAMKATYIELGEYQVPNDCGCGEGYQDPTCYSMLGGCNKQYNIIGREIFKNPITDDGTKKSARGLLRVIKDDQGEYKLEDQVNWDLEKSGELVTVFEDGKLLKEYSLSEIRENIRK